MLKQDQFKTEALMDEHAVDAFAVMMKSKLAASRAKGRAGWHDPARCPIGSLEALFMEHLGKANPGNYVDLATIAMMIHIRTEWANYADGRQ